MRQTLAGLLVITLSSATGVAMGQAPAPSPLAGMFACADLTDAGQRLACYDAEVARVRSAEQAGRITTLDAAQIETLSRESFGFALPNLAALLPHHEAETPRQMEATISRVTSREGKAAFVLDNGQVWRVVDSSRNRNARAGAKVTIRRAALGSFMLAPEGGGAALRVRRED